jgi:hypothetical protein
MTRQGRQGGQGGQGGQEDKAVKSPFIRGFILPCPPPLPVFLVST